MPTIFLDMDGVAADWVTGCANVIGRRIEDPHVHCTDEEWALMRQQGRFFRDLPKMPSADDLVAVARKFRDELGYGLVFLTAIPHNNDVPWTFHDKMLWARDNYEDIPVHFGPYSQDKHKHCTCPDDVLIDDRHDNCMDWAKAGGTAIIMSSNPAHYNDATNALMQLFVSKKIS
jgi:hypothetical protein